MSDFKLGQIEGKLDTLIELTKGIDTRSQKHGEDISKLVEKTDNNETHIWRVSKKFDRYATWIVLLICSVLGASWFVR